MIRFLHKFFPAPPVIKLFLFAGIVWAAIVAPLSSVLILVNIGATSPQVGIFTALCAVISMVFQPVWGLLGDKTGSPRKVLCFCLGVSAVFFICVLLTKNLYVAAVLMILENVFRCSVIALLDSYTLSEMYAIPGLQYNHIRLAGSVFYGILSLIYSGIIDAWGVMSIIPISFCIAALAVFMGLFVIKSQWEAGQYHARGVHKVKPNLKREAISLFQNRRYIVFILHAAFYALSTLPLFFFIVYYVNAVGGNSGDAMMICALRCCSELFFFILIGTAGRRLGAKELMLTGVCLTFVYIVGLLFARTLLWLTVFHLLGAPGYIISLTGRMRYLSEITPAAVRSTSITVMGAFEACFGSVLGNLVAGFLLGAFGTHALTLVALAALFATMLMLALMTAERNKPNPHP